MEKPKRSKDMLITGVALLLLVLVVAAIFWEKSPTILYPQEIREYQGQNLSSIGDFRENSIRGPQNVNASAYRLRITGLVNAPKEHNYNEIVSSFQKYQKVVTLHCVEGWSTKILWEASY